jgi:hypothetical protein
LRERNSAGSYLAARKDWHVTPSQECTEKAWSRLKNVLGYN